MSRSRQRGPDLAERLRALHDVVTLTDGVLDDRDLAPARDTLRRAGERRRVSTGHTVVALAGATGSGKSSLFNAVVGVELAEVGVRRPTTSEATACVWGAENPDELLSWLQVPAHRRTSRRSALDAPVGTGPTAGGESDGLVLLDLPDHDSTRTENRRTVDRLVGQVDLFVWVLDPQKYADAALHDRYLRPLAPHADVTVVVLNQVDRLTDADLRACRAHLSTLLEQDGLGSVPLLATSARTGVGVDALRDLIGARVEGARASDLRSAADVDDAVARLLPALGSLPDGELPEATRRRVLDELAGSVGADAVATAAGRAHRRRGHLATGWPLTRGLRRFRADPLRQLGLGSGSAGSAGSAGDRGAPELRRSSLPVATPANRARADSALRALGDAVVAGEHGPVATRVRAAARPAESDLTDRLDQAVQQVDLQLQAPRWWRLAALIQWLGVATVLVGAGWLLALFGLSLLQVDVPSPQAGPLPVPTLLLGSGLLVGLLVTNGSAAVNRAGALRRERAVRTDLRRAVGVVVDETVLAPVQEEMRRVAELRTALDTAGAVHSR